MQIVVCEILFQSFMTAKLNYIEMERFFSFNNVRLLNEIREWWEHISIRFIFERDYLFSRQSFLIISIDAFDHICLKLIWTADA